ncbi:hypothetical protein ACLB2K_020148 [Fragaria x ananassa]
MATRGSRSEKVKHIFYQFDVNHDGGLNREEMAALVVAVNPRVKFSDEQINAILDEVFRTYIDFIDGEKGLTYEGLLRTYDDGAGDVDRDFDALGLELSLDEVKGASMASEASSSSIVDERVGKSQKKQRMAAWAVSPNHGIVFDDTWKIVDDLEILVKRLKAKQAGSNGKVKGENLDSYSEAGWSRGWSRKHGWHGDKSLHTPKLVSLAASLSTATMIISEKNLREISKYLFQEGVC